MLGFLSQTRRLAIAQWYHSQRGQTLGPLGDADVESMIRSRQLGPDDLIYHAGDPKWQPLSEIQRFKGILHELGGDALVDPQQQDLWVLLVKTEKGERRQKGPFAAVEIKALLASGEIKSSDYVWRQGMKNWYRVISFPELVVGPKTQGQRKPQKNVRKNLQKKNTKGSEDLLKHVLELKKEFSATLEDMRPPEAIGPDLVKEGAIAAEIPLPESSSISRIHIPWPVRPKPGRRPLNDRRFYQAAVIGVALAGLWFGGRGLIQFVQKILPAERKEIPVKPIRRPPKKERRAEAVVTPTKSTPAKISQSKPTMVPTPKPRPPSYLRAAVRGGQLQILTDASPHFRAKIHFHSLPGEIVGAHSSYRTLQLKERDLDLKSLKWPAGFYQTQIQVGDHEAKLKLFVGERNSDFAKSLQRHNKGLTLPLMGERIALITYTRQMLDALGGLDEALAKKDLTGLRNRIKKLRADEIRNISRKSREKYIFSTIWLELKEQHNAVENLLQRLGAGEQLQGSTKSDLRGFRTRLQQEHEAAQNFSLWK